MSPGIPSTGIADKERGITEKQRGLIEKEHDRVSMSKPFASSNGTDIADRGIADMTIPAIVNRLTRCALRYYGKRRGSGLSAPAVFTETELSLIKTMETDREGEWFRTEKKFNEYFLTLYECDVKEFAWIIKREFPSQLRNALRQNEIQAKEMQNEALSTEILRGIHLDAKDYFDVLKQKRSETPVTRTGGVAEGRQSIVEAPREAVKEIDNPWLTVLFSADSNLLGTLAESEVAARKALEALFKRQLEDIHGFRQAILVDQNPLQEPSPIWRYPPIVVEIVSKYSDSRHLQRFAVDMIAQPRAQGLLGRPELKVGLLLFGLAGLLVTTGPVGVVLAVTDFGLAAIDTYQSYMRERENDLANGASLIRQGAIFTERQSDYTGVFGSLAATLLSGLFLLKMIPRSRTLGHLPEARAKGSPAKQAIEQAERGKAGGKEIPPDNTVSNEARGAKPRSTSYRGVEPRTEPTEAISQKGSEDIRNVDKQIKPEERSISDPKVEDQRTLNRSAEPVEATEAEAKARRTAKSTPEIDAAEKQREKLAADFEKRGRNYLQEKERTFAQGENEVKKKLDIPTEKEAENTVDQIGITAGERYNFTEFKNTTVEFVSEDNITKALKQHNNTLKYFTKKFPDKKIGEIRIMIPKHAKLEKIYRVSTRGGRNFLEKQVDGIWKIYKTEIGGHYIVIVGI